MRKVNIRTLRSNLSEQLEDIPFGITKHGELVATVNEPGKSYEIPKKKEFVPTCKHGYPAKICQKCKK